MPRRHMMRRKVILDCDPGHDDAIAILLAARSPALDVRAITVVAGNQTLEKTLHNALRVCSFAGIRDIPIAAGMSQPLVRDQILAGDIHGASGLDGPALGEPTIAPVPTHAVDLIVEEVLAAPGEITLVPTGPLTNIAAALRREPHIAGKLQGIVLMGGAIAGGNITPAAEFNIYADPEAAHIVFTSGVAVAEVMAPGIVRTERVNVEIETKGVLTYGMTVCDMYGVTGRAPNCAVGVELDRMRFYDLLIEGLARYGGTGNG